MKLDIFSELQSGHDSPETDARTLLENNLEQAKLADEMGFGCWWAVEHHTDPAFSFSSAPDLLLAAIARETRRIRLGTAGILSPFEINHPIRIAERAAMVDVLSGGRLELGLARSGGAEWSTFGVDPDTTRQQLREALQMIPRIWTETNFHWKSDLLEIPERDFVPKPLQQPHPPLWQTVSGPESCEMAGTLGVGMLGSAPFVPLERMSEAMERYDAGLATCRPAGQRTNDQRAFFTIFHCAETRQQAIESGAAEAALWFMNVAPRVFRVPRENWVNLIRGNASKGAASGPVLEGPEPPPTREELDDPVRVIALMNRQRIGEALDPEEVFDAVEPYDTAIIGDVESCGRKLRRIADLGVDRLLCLMQFGRLPHEEVMRSIRTTGEALIPALRGSA